MSGTNTQANEELLNLLVQSGFTAEIPGTFGALLRWGEDNPVLWEKVSYRSKLNPIPHAYLFEIGRNCGTVFSADCVKEITINGRHAIIRLKG